MVWRPFGWLLARAAHPCPHAPLTDQTAVERGLPKPSRRAGVRGGGKPFPCEHLLCQCLVHMWASELLECERNLTVLSRTVLRSILGMVLVLDDLGKVGRIGAVGHAQEIEEALRR